jgi:3-hydroxyacyl-CoA dehydrogenase
MSRTERVTVIGVGLLGRGIASVTARAKFDVVLYDHDPEVSRRAVDHLASQGLDVRTASSIEEAVTGADYVIEAAQVARVIPAVAKTKVPATAATYVYAESPQRRLPVLPSLPAFWRYSGHGTFEETLDKSAEKGMS